MTRPARQMPTMIWEEQLEFDHLMYGKEINVKRFLLVIPWGLHLGFSNNFSSVRFPPIPCLLYYKKLTGTRSEVRTSSGHCSNTKAMGQELQEEANKKINFGPWVDVKLSNGWAAKASS